MASSSRVRLNTLLILTHISLALSLIIIGISLGTGALSIATLLASVGTTIYHIVILSRQYCGCCNRRRRRNNVDGVVDNADDCTFFAGTTNGALVWAFLLAQFWVLSELSLLQLASTSAIARANNSRTGPYRYGQLTAIGALVLFGLGMIEMSVVVGLAVTSVLFRCEMHAQTVRTAGILS